MISCKQKIQCFNGLPLEESGKIPELAKEILGKTGEALWIEPPFYCDCGCNIEVGEGFFAGHGLTVHDVGKVVIGNHVCFAPHVRIDTEIHMVYPDAGAGRTRYGIPVVIGDDVTVGKNTRIQSGVVIHDGAVIGEGSTLANAVSVGKNACIGKHVVVMPGVAIGDGAVIDDRCIVTEDVPERIVSNFL